MPSPERSDRPLPRRPVLFPPGTPPARRRRRLAFAALFAVVAAAAVWPLYPLGAGLLPPVLGLPPSFAWVVGALVAGFLLLVGLFVGDLREERAGRVRRRGDGGSAGDAGNGG